MPDPQTSNLQLFVPLNGADVGSWDVPLNANFNQLDNVLGSGVSVALSNVPVTLSGAQYNARVITFTGTLTADVQVTFPAYGRTWVVYNTCGANTTFKVTCRSSTLTNYIALPPNEAMTVLSDGSGTTMRFMNLGRIGTYWDFAGSAVPIWVSGTNPVPYLNCDGTAFSSATYPALRDYLGGTTLPDARGRFRATLNQTTARLTGTSRQNGLDGNTLLNTGGNQTMSSSINLPPHAHQLPAGLGVDTVAIGNGAGVVSTVWLFGNTGLTDFAGGGQPYAPPSYTGGLTLIRSG